MKKLIIVCIVALAFVGCTISPEKKASTIVEESVKSSLYHPESYDPINTVLDSAFAPMDDPDFFDKTLKLFKLGLEMDQCDRQIKHAKSSMAIWSHPYDAFSKNEYNEAKEDYDKYVAKMETMQKKAEKLGGELKTIAEQGRRFIGWKATHSYRAKNNAGQTLICESLFILDPEITKILAGYNTDDSDYKNVQMMYEMMKEAEE